LATPRILVCFALKEEATPFRKMAYPLHEPALAIRLVGIGRRNAEKFIREYLVSHTPGLVLTCGFAGGLNPALKLGDVVFSLSTLNSQLSTLTPPPPSATSWSRW